jgi:hypothetical protein
MSAKEVLFNRVLAQLKAELPYFTTAAIIGRVKAHKVEISEATLPVYLTEATASGLIHDAGRGWYSRLSESARLDPKPVEPVVKLLAKKFPLLDFHCWSTVQVNPWMHHLLGKGVTFVNTDSEAMESVADCLREAGYDTHLNPTGAAKNRFAIRDKTVVVRRRVIGAPEENHFSRLETLLVDLFLESDRLALMDVGEFREMAVAAVSSGRISVPKLINYAANRKKRWEDVFGADVVNQRHLFTKGDES